MSYIEINLTNLADNYELIKSKLDKATTCAAAVKADGYGLGASAVASTLSAKGCKDFFVAHIDEALTLRKTITSNIYCLHGLTTIEEAKTLEQAGIIPILNSVEQCQRYHDYAVSINKKLPAILNFDTNMGRLGLSINDNIPLEHIECKYIMSHLACADDPEHTHNHKQFSNFLALKSKYPNYKYSLANSSGIFLDKKYHFDLVRPGCGIYGINPTSSINPMKNVVSIFGKVLQKRTHCEDSEIGYGASAFLRKGSKSFIVEYGYADGYLRSLSNIAACYVKGYELPLKGRVSMDLLIFDATILPDHIFQQTEYVELLGNNITLDRLAKDAGSIGYEILTSLSRRVQRNYL